MYFRPGTLDEAVARLRRRAAASWRAERTSFRRRASGRRPGRSSTSRGWRSWTASSVGDDRIRIGARTSWSTIIATPLPRCFDALKAAAREVGSVQIQNLGTIAGNLCNASPPPTACRRCWRWMPRWSCGPAPAPAPCPCPSFISGNRRTARREDEIVTAVIVPRTIDAGASAFLKLGARRYLVISIAMVAAVVEADADGRVAQARIAVGSCSAVAQRLTALEQDLVGAPARPGLGARGPAGASGAAVADRRRPRQRRLPPGCGPDPGAPRARCLRPGAAAEI